MKFPAKLPSAINATSRSVDAATLELSRNISTVLEQLLQNYDNRQRPDHGGSPTIVTTNFLIRSMGPISELDMVLKPDLYDFPTNTIHFPFD
ncbi:gamma-aminobutyric acid receptor alpha-like protein [Caerostris extrusa]|uniref:Gamma-aminobutyric acid receptor alpha-like protein n=1 Tax=Caerostris extrusa TaxID=172846 RepID=A0AAV4WDH2_CAEEX|nr:gamma-aminobutyric acid receptor alpha-like protein [Caerostris extrusa]